MNFKTPNLTAALQALCAKHYMTLSPAPKLVRVGCSETQFMVKFTIGRNEDYGTHMGFDSMLECYVNVITNSNTCTMQCKITSEDAINHHSKTDEHSLKFLEELMGIIKHLCSEEITQVALSDVLEAVAAHKHKKAQEAAF